MVSGWQQPPCSSACWRRCILLELRHGLRQLRACGTNSVHFAEASMDEVAAQPAQANRQLRISDWLITHYQLVVIVVASAIYLACIVSPPSLMDDVDSVQASIAHTMLQ